MGYDDSITMLHEIIPNRLSKKNYYELCKYRKDDHYCKSSDINEDEFYKICKKQIEKDPLKIRHINNIYMAKIIRNCALWHWRI